MASGRKVHVLENNAPIVWCDYKPRRSRTRRTCIGNHWPPIGVAMACALRSIAIAFDEMRPALMHRSMCGRSASACSTALVIDSGLLWIAELDAARFRRRQRMLGAVADGVPPLLGGGGQA